MKVCGKTETERKTSALLIDALSAAFKDDPRAKPSCAGLKVLNTLSADTLGWRRFLEAVAWRLERLDEKERLEVASGLEAFMWHYGPNPLILSAALDTYVAETWSHEIIGHRLGGQILLAIAPFTLPETVLTLIGSSDRTTVLLAMRRARNELIMPIRDLLLPGHWRPLIAQGIDAVLTRWGSDREVLEEVKAWGEALKDVKWSKHIQRHDLLKEEAPA